MEAQVFAAYEGDQSTEKSNLYANISTVCGWREAVYQKKKDQESRLSFHRQMRIVVELFVGLN